MNESNLNRKEKYEELRTYLVSKYWDLYLSAVEKMTLQKLSSEPVGQYNLSDEEKKALMFLDTKELRMVRR